MIIRDVFRGGAMGAKPPWTSEIYWFQGSFRPQWVLERKKCKPPPWTKYALDDYTSSIYIYTLLVRLSVCLILCPFVSNNRQNGWTDRAQAFCRTSHDSRKNLWMPKSTKFVKFWKCGEKILNPWNLFFYCFILYKKKMPSIYMYI